MKMYVCSVFDRKIGAFMIPQFFRSKGEATRAFMDACNGEQAQLRKHAEDFVFMFLGYWEDGDGRFERPPGEGGVSEILMSAMDCVSIDSGVN
ncbi:nonstructural protein [robinz microvirus RP_115]|nr:nonstructural protein [robinz microvirus RP_115]